MSVTSSFVLFEDSHWERFLPLVYLRGLFELRCGISELWRRVERVSSGSSDLTEVEFWCRPKLAPLVGEQTGRLANREATAGTLLLNGRGFWTSLPDVASDSGAWVGTAGSEDDVACIWTDDALAARLSAELMLDESELANVTAGLPRRDVSHLVTLFQWPWELVHFSAAAIEADWQSAGLRGAVEASPGVHLLNPARIHVGGGSRIKPCVVIDAEEGPVWIGANVTVEPHSYIQGPCYIGNDSIIQPGAVVHEGCSFGPRCKVGGEVEASIIQGFSNKQHDGFLGHAYLGSWINIGADCLNSDLKNTYGTIRVPVNGQEVETGMQFIGMMMGDFSKTGINVAFPTGAVVGVCSNVVVPAPPKFVPSFTWLDSGGARPFDVDRALGTAEKMMARRNRRVTPTLEAAVRSATAQAARFETAPGE